MYGVLKVIHKDHPSLKISKEKDSIVKKLKEDRKKIDKLGLSVQKRENVRERSTCR